MEMMELLYYLWNIKLDFRSINKYAIENNCNGRKMKVLTQ